MKHTTIACTPRLSTQIILSAVIDHMDKTGCKQKAIASEAGVAENYLSMIKGKFKASMARIPGLKRAMPGLDAHELTGAIFTESFDAKMLSPEDEDAAIGTVISFMEWYASQPAVEASLISIMASVRSEDEASGLDMPAELSASTLAGIKALIKADVQRENLARREDLVS